MRPLAALSCVVLCASAGAAFAQSPSNDLRQFRIGMAVGALPATGYQDFACADQPAHTLAGWSDFGACPKDERGLHEVSFRYGAASNPRAYLGGQYRGTRVAGHPVRVSLMIDGSGTVKGIRIATDPDTPRYLHKKAFLFADQAQAHYGREGWRCTDTKPSDDREAVGGVYIDRHCEKTTATRQLLVDQELFRKSGQPLADFVSGARLTILASPGQGQQ